MQRGPTFCPSGVFNFPCFSSFQMRIASLQALPVPVLSTVVPISHMGLFKLKYKLMKIKKNAKTLNHSNTIAMFQVVYSHVWLPCRTVWYNCFHQHTKFCWTSLQTVNSERAEGLCVCVYVCICIFAFVRINSIIFSAEMGVPDREKLPVTVLCTSELRRRGEWRDFILHMLGLMLCFFSLTRADVPSEGNTFQEWFL